MKKTRILIRLISVFFLVFIVGVSAYYIPLKFNVISPTEITKNTFTQVIDYSSNFSASIARSTKESLRNRSLNIFSIEPKQYLKINAPTFNLLPLIFNPSLNSKKPLVDSLNKTNSPIVLQKTTKPEDSLVNIFCSQKIGTLRRTITGSGVLINKDGTVLTNAHVAQFPLLSETNKNIVCLARYGNPAGGSLSVKVVFISPEWTKEYGKYINTEGRAQTGKSDFALLRISQGSGIEFIEKTSNIRPGNQTKEQEKLVPIKILDLKNAFPAIGEAIYPISYPANILGVKGVNTSLPLQKETLTVNNYYSVGTLSNDVLETSPSSYLGQKGSSGGAITNDKGELVATITTVVNSSNISKKIIRGMTIAHVDAELFRASNTNLTTIVNFGSSDLEKTFKLQYKDYLTSLLDNYLNSL